jgi:hypothetical protein
MSSGKAIGRGESTVKKLAYISHPVQPVSSRIWACQPTYLGCLLAGGDSWGDPRLPVQRLDEQPRFEHLAGPGGIG